MASNTLRPGSPTAEDDDDGRKKARLNVGGVIHQVGCSSEVKQYHQQLFTKVFSLRIPQ